MKLFVDDVRDAPDDSWHVVRTVTEAIRCLYRFKADIKEISIDHDIGHVNVQAYDDEGVWIPDQKISCACPETFEAVAYFIGELWLLERNLEVNGYKELGVHIASPGLSPKVTIHSVNPQGAQKIKDVLKESGIDAELRPAII